MPVQIDIDGIPIIFPFDPYSIQEDYMRAVINSLQNKQNALLESPTGTGKTLSLLCSTLGWLQHRKYLGLDLATDLPEPTNEYPIANVKEEKQLQNGKPKTGKGWKNESSIKIVYSSRTHSQLNQACGELKNSYYKYCPTITIGSRDQMCINPEVMNLETISAKNHTCRMKVKSNSCKYHNNYERKMSDLSFEGATVYDIEDMVKFGNEHQACPYYLAKAKADFNTELIFMPYNYILDPGIRSKLKLNLEKAVIIFDEGHNIEQVCEDSMSTELKSESLATFISSFDNVLKSLKLLEEGQYDGTNEKELAELNIVDIAQIKLAMCDLEVELNQMINKKKSNECYDTQTIFHIFDKVGLDNSKCAKILEICEKVKSYMMNSLTGYMVSTTITALAAVCSFLEMITPFQEKSDDSIDGNSFRKEFIKNYSMYSVLEGDDNTYNKNSWKKKKSEFSWTLHLVCLSPSVAIKTLLNLGVHNIIITSGTLAPLESFEWEMDTPFPIKLQNSHVISMNQLLIQLISKDPNRNDLCGAFTNRENPLYYNGLGLTIIELARNIPKGVFIFFSSYSLINKCIENWKNGNGPNMFNAISGLKQVFVEPRGKREFQESLLRYKETVDKSVSGAIYMAVSRGKLSEGMDLADDYCRAVIIVGLPYPALYDPKVVLKQKYLDKNNSKLNGKKWYMLQMKRALNQSVGRVVRHKNDYGSIILCDNRFSSLNDGLSKWVQGFIRSNDAFKNSDFRIVMKNVQNFYKQASNTVSERTNNKNTSLPLPALADTGSTSSEMKYQHSAFKSPVIPKTLSKSHDSTEAALESIINSYKSSNSAQTPTSKRAQDQLDSASIFDSINEPYANGSAKRQQSIRNMFATSTFTRQFSSNSETKSKNLFSNMDYFKNHRLENVEDEIENIPTENKSTTRNENIRNTSKYFSKLEKSQQQIDNKGSKSPVPIIDLDDDYEIDMLAEKQCSTLQVPSCQPSTSIETSPSNSCVSGFNFESDDIVNLKKTLFLSERDRNTFMNILIEIQNSDLKYRQLIQTCNIYFKKRNVNYLGLRMNFILSNVSQDKRECLLKDLSLIVPPSEQRLFLKTCKVLT